MIFIVSHFAVGDTCLCWHSYSISDSTWACTMFEEIGPYRALTPTFGWHVLSSIVCSNRAGQLHSCACIDRNSYRLERRRARTFGYGLGEIKETMAALV